MKHMTWMTAREFDEWDAEQTAEFMLNNKKRAQDLADKTGIPLDHAKTIVGCITKAVLNDITERAR